MQNRQLHRPLRFFLIAALLAVGIPMADAADGWEKARFGRPHPAKLNWSIDPVVAEAFIPSGVGSHILRCGEYTVLQNHGLYFSNEENPDTSKDMQASIIVFKGDRRVLVARGYKFAAVQWNAAKKKITFDHWSGVMGDKQIESLVLDYSGDEIRCTTSQFPTRQGMGQFAAGPTANRLVLRAPGPLGA